MAKSNDATIETEVLSLDFKYCPEIKPTNSEVVDFYTRLEGAKEECEVKKLMKEFVTLYVSRNEDESFRQLARSTIIHLFTKFNGKKNLKKYLLDLVAKQNLATPIVKETAKEIWEGMKTDKICDVKKCNKFLHFVSVLQASPHYDFEENFKVLFPLYLSLFDSYAIHASKVKQDIVQETEDINILINTVLKQILPIFVKKTSLLENLNSQCMRSILMYSYILLYNEKIGFDLRMKVCLVFVYSFSVLEGDGMCVSQLISRNGSPFNISVNSEDEANTPVDYFIIMYSSILCVIPEDKLLTEKVDDKILLIVLFEGILDSAKRNSKHSQIIVETSRALCHISKHLQSVPVEYLKHIFMEGLFYVSSHVDHFIDTVRNYSRIFYEDLVSLAGFRYHHDISDLTDILMKKIEDTSKDSTMRFYSYENIAKYYGCDFLLKQFENLPLVLLESIDNPAVSEQLCKTYQLLVEKNFEPSLDSPWVQTWVLPVVNALKSGKERENFCQKIFSTAFKLQPAILRMIFPHNFIGTVEQSKIMLHCLHYARKNGIEMTLEKDNKLYWRGLIDKQKMDMFMIHQDEEMRLLALGAVAESLKSTELFLEWEFAFLSSFIRYNIAVPSPNTRKQIVAYYKKVLLRYDAGSKVIERSVANLSKTDTGKHHNTCVVVFQELKKKYKAFIGNLALYLIGNLSCDSNFPRRAVSLELLLVVRDVLTPNQWKNCWSEDDVKVSHNILFDTYEGNKKMIVELLKSLPPHHLGFTNSNFTKTYMHRSFDLGQDVKPSKTLSAAYLCEMCTYSPYFISLVSKENEPVAIEDNTYHMIQILTHKLIHLKDTMRIDHAKLSKAACYGTILSIRHLLENRDVRKEMKAYAKIFVELIDVCFDVSKKLMPIVCNQSPEGHLPDNLDDVNENDESSKAQLILVYAWRTIKEITLLLAEIVKQSVKVEDEYRMVPEDLIIKVGWWFFDVFIHSKHRGVFEQAYVGFSTVCESMWRSRQSKVCASPNFFLVETLELCAGAKAKSSDLCPTRRSAGLPFLILAVLSTAPDGTYFETTMRKLLTAAEARDNSDEVRMHCLNVLRAIYRHSKLGELVASYVAKGVILAVNGFKSQTWGVRNSSTLLFATLITRIFGVPRSTDPERVCMKNKLTVKVFFLRYEELYRFMLESLAEECKNDSSEILKPLLLIMSRLYPSKFDEDQSKASEFLPHINVCLGNPDQRIREAAAVASVALFHENGVRARFDECFARINDRSVGDNECYGILFQVLHIFNVHQMTDLPLVRYLELSEHIWDTDNRRYSHMTVTLYTRLVTEFLYRVKDFDDLYWLKRILLHLSKLKKTEAKAFTAQSVFPLARIVLAYYIIINKLEETVVTYVTLATEITSFLYGPQSVMKTYCLQLLICLNSAQAHYTAIENGTLDLNLMLDRDDSVAPSDPEPRMHPLFKTDTVKLSHCIVQLVSSFSRRSVEHILHTIHGYLNVFLSEEVKREQYLKGDDRVLLFLLLNYFPCVIRSLRLSKQETLDTLLNLCDCDNEELVSAVISCISTLLADASCGDVDCRRLIEVLSQSASPAAALHRRLAVAEFLCQNCAMYCNKDAILQGDQLCSVLNIVMILLEDEDLDVRNSMSLYDMSLTVRMRTYMMQDIIPNCRWPVVPEKAREDLIHLFSVLLPLEKAVCLIFSWACRYFPDPDREEHELFERGGLNQYAENTPLIELCGVVLVNKLWKLPEGLSYDDRTIFIEEQTLIVTTILLDSLQNHDSPMMLKQTKTTVICALKSMYKFLLNYHFGNNFVADFRTYFNDKILNYFTSFLLHGDLFSVKKLFKMLYDPVFKYRS